MLRIFIALAVAGSAISSASAHPLHGSDLATALIHPFAGVDHLLAALAVGMWAARMGGRATWMVPAAFVSAMLLGCVLAIAGYSLGAVEPMIAVSVAVFGIALLLRSAGGAVLASALAAYFALFHGMAHATELGGSGVTIVAGLVSATAALHAIGIVAARTLPALVPAIGAALAAAGAWWVAAAVV